MQYPKLYLCSLKSEVRTGSGNASGTRMMLWMPLPKAVCMPPSDSKNWEQPRTAVSLRCLGAVVGSFYLHYIMQILPSFRTTDVFGFTIDYAGIVSSVACCGPMAVVLFSF